MNQTSRKTIWPLASLFLSVQFLCPQASSAQAAADLNSIEWIHGEADCEAAQKEPGYIEWQTVRYQENTVIFRQNKCSNYEAPFVYLFIGTEQSLLIDTGATEAGGPGLLAAIRDITRTPLIVAHSHGHGDHTQGDSTFSNAKDAVVVGTGAEAVQEFFGFTNWPAEATVLELGNRSIELLPVPGHTDDDIAYYDPVSQFVITGDTLYPGRLYVRNWQGYRASIARLSEWLQSKPVSYVLGTHIEMSAEVNVDYPVRTTYQPNEHPLPLTISAITTLNETLAPIESPERTYLKSFIVWPL